MTKIGKLFYNYTLKSATFLDKHKILLFFLLFTWGIITTIISLTFSLILLLCFRKPYKYHWTYYFKVGKFWGGFGLGFMFVRDKESDITLNEHEFGHLYQAAILGPFFIFLVAIPSFIRYWWLTFTKQIEIVDYDAIWFERSATDIGENVTELDVK